MTDYRALQQGNALTVEWFPGHRGIAGNEAADAYAKGAAERRNLGKTAV